MTKREDQAREYAADFSYVKVYGSRGDSNTFGLTPEEREAVEWAIFEYGATRPDHGMAVARAATLRGLLERTK